MVWGSGVAVTAGAGVTINAASAASSLSSQHSVASLMKLDITNAIRAVGRFAGAGLNLLIG
jgi:hypothetical protein